MSDQLLSQADVDALISSLTDGGGITPPPKADSAKSENKPNKISKSEPEIKKPETVSTEKPVDNKLIQDKTNNAQHKQFVNNENKQDMSNDMLNKINDKINELAEQVEKTNKIARRIDILEKRMSSLESHIYKNNNNKEVEQKVKELSKEIKKIIIGLKGTPGYGVKYTFNCEQCGDKGHVAVKYRCTNCGKERWYGWWPEK
jgi:ribosomal protein L37E